METMEVEVETNIEVREDVELVWDDWGHDRDVRDHTGDGWDHVEDVVVVGESRRRFLNRWCPASGMEKSNFPGVEL